MDAREQLRRYLEQRRELGEQELVLDRLEVDDVLRMVGALGAGAAGKQPAQPAAGEAEPPRPGVREPSPERRPAPGEDRVGQADRSGDFRPAARDDARSGTPAGPLGDWRETLRAAGGGPPGAVTPAAGGRQNQTDEEGEMARRKKADTASSESQDDGTAADDGPKKAAAKGAGRSSAGKLAGKSAGKSAASATEGAASLPPWVAELDVPAGLSVGEAGALDDVFARLRSLDELARATEKCTRCPLYRTATHAVPGDGNPDADLVCVGEAPGANEDASGHPFVGAAGQLLTKILAAINLSREDVFICNVLKHRPPGNRNPQPDEVEACSPYLLRQLELVKPKVILTLGTFAAQTLLATKTPIGKLRGQVHLYHGIPLVVTYHPAALLRNSAWKRPTWEDVQLARRLLDSVPRSGA